MRNKAAIIVAIASIVGRSVFAAVPPSPAVGYAITVPVLDKMSVSYTVTAATIAISVTADLGSNDGLIAVGFNTVQKMAGTDAIIGRSSGVKAFGLTGYSESGPKPSGYMTEESYSCQGTVCTLAFKRLLATGSAGDVPLTISPAGKFKLIFALSAIPTAHTIVRQLVELDANQAIVPVLPPMPAKPPTIAIPMAIFALVALTSLAIHKLGRPAVFHKPLTRLLPDVSLGTVVAVVAWLAAILVHAFVCYELQVPFRIASAEIAMDFAAIGFALTARSGIWVHVFGLPLERSVPFHMMCGLTSYAAVVAHLVSVILDLQVKTVISTDPINDATPLLGLIAFIAFTLLILVTLVRRYSWELFYYGHIILATGFLITTVIHYRSNAIIWAVPLVVYLIDIVIRLTASTSTVKVETFKPREEITLLEVTPQKKSLLNYEAGSYFFIQVPRIDATWHPFSNMNPEGATTLSFGIRKQHKVQWTGKLYELAKHTAAGSSPAVLLMGPYGKISHSVDFNHSTHVILVAGGIGITAMKSIFLDLLNKHKNGQLQKLKSVVLVWITKGNLRLVEDCNSLIADDEIFKLMVYHTGKHKDALVGHSIKVTEGRPPLESIFPANGVRGSRTAVLTCGPAAVVASAEKYALKENYSFHKESFAL